MLDGACETERLVGRVKELGMPAVAMTDHGNIFGAVTFVNAAKEAGVKPILGCELYICKKEDHRAAPEGDSYNHLIVLAENDEGYRNLVKIVSEASLHGFYYKPRVSKKFLAEHAQGLIGLSACLKGEVAENLVEGKYEAAREAASTFNDIFGNGNFYLEIQDQGVPEEKRIQPNLLKLEQDLGIPLVATNDSHYLCEDDAHAQDVMVCIQTGKSINDTNRLKFHGNQFFVKTAAEMAKVFHGYERVLARTMEIAERCNVRAGKSPRPVPAVRGSRWLHAAAITSSTSRREGFARRLNILRELQAMGRLKHSLEDYESASRARSTSSARCSSPDTSSSSGTSSATRRRATSRSDRAAARLPDRWWPTRSASPTSIRSQNELLFERFLNPERISMPDIDIDFCMNRRGEVIDYVTQKYGRDQVAQIITFGTMAAKAAIKDSGRAMDMPYAEVERIAKMVPQTLNITIDQALKDSPPLATAYENEPQTKELIDTAKKLEGLVRNSGVHAAGVVIAPQPLTDLVPLHRTKNDEIVTAYDMKAVEKLGLLKMDFLGLTTLTIIDDALRLIEQTRGHRIDLEKLALDDQVTYEKVFHTGLTSGVFQFESHGMRDVLRRYKPTVVEDLTALNALYRPGPIQGGMIEDFIERK